MGAVIFEKHFTLRKDLPGPDHWLSADPIDLKEWVNSIHDSCVMMGNGIVRPTSKEIANKKEFQRVIVALGNIQAGDTFTSDNLVMRRVAGGHGLEPRLLDKLLEKTAKRAFHAGEPIDL